MIENHYISAGNNGAAELSLVSASNVDRLVYSVCEKVRGGEYVYIGLDVDKTIVFHTPKEGMIEAAPDAFFPPGLKDVIVQLNSQKNLICYAVTGRSVDFINEHFGLRGSGQFHAEMTTLDTGERVVLKPPMNSALVMPIFEKLVGEYGGYLETDKSHHLCHMVGVSEGYLREAFRLVSAYNASHEVKVLAEHGEDFFEIGPAQTSKDQALMDVLSQDINFSQGFHVFCGDTPEKDGPAMDLVRSFGGVAVGVGKKFEREPCILHVESPTGVYRLLEGIRRELAR